MLNGDHQNCLKTELNLIDPSLIFSLYDPYFRKILYVLPNDAELPLLQKFMKQIVKYTIVHQHHLLPLAPFINLPNLIFTMTLYK